MTSWHSYPKVYAIGHSYLRDLFLDPVHFEEKVDGSQFSFGVIDGALRCRSKGKEIVLDAPEKMFLRGIETASDLAGKLTPGWTYRGEYLQSPKHNVLAYDRIPERHVVLFDINTGHEQYLDYGAKRAEADRIGLECVPVMASGRYETADAVLALLETRSMLGGQKVEGVVGKNYARFGLDGKALLGKYVSEAFKEVHAGEWRAQNPSNGDVVDLVIAALRTPARWDKAVQHMREAGRLTDSPKDIGTLIKETQADIGSECEAEIKQRLFDWAWPKISRGVIAGLPEWYKQKLLTSAFEDESSKRGEGGR